MKIGIDIGGVLINRDTDSEKLFFSENFISTPEVRASIQCIKFLISKFSSENIYLISKCSKHIEEKTIEWLNHRYFFSETEFSRDNLIFCRTRIEKASIAEHLGLDAFIDDRFSVLEHMTKNPKNMTLILFNPTPEEIPLSPVNNLFLVNHWYWILGLLSSKNESVLPLPPKWYFITKKESLDLLNRFFISNPLLSKIEIIMRSENEAIGKYKSRYFKIFLDWNSNDLKDILSLLKKNNLFPKSSMVNYIYQLE
ncbi:MAG: hypothetical protein SFU98_13050 [Leptospiraceae bacterium]|nr:hypothetical protein [Leptospiraceae bacterium]